MPLRDYQHQGVKHLHTYDHAALFMDMGLGKTATVLSALTSEHLPALVVAPKRVAETVWEEERDLWRPDLTIAVAMGSPTKRAAALSAQADITVLGRDNFGDILARKDRPWRTLVIDELSGYKGRGVRWKQMVKYIWGKHPVPHVWGLTGTPTPNGLLDLWPQIYLLDRGHRLGGGERLGDGVGKYRNRYFTAGRRLPNGIIANWDLRPGADKKIYALIDDICLSMGTEGRVDLPPVTHNEVTITLPPAAVKAYKDMKKDLVANLKLIGGVVHTAANTAIMTSKLSQITAGFLYGDDYDLDGSISRIHDEKIKAVQEIIEGTGSPVLVFYQFREGEKDALLKALPQARTINEPGVIKAWNRGEVPVLLAHPQSAGHGLNLQHGGHTAIWAGLTWSSEEWEQGNKRLIRSGQQHPVIIHRIVARAPSGARTVDHLKYLRVQDKVAVQDDLLAYLEDRDML